VSYRTVKDRVGAAAERAGRNPGDIRIVVISKNRSVDDIMAIYEQGHRDFGENRAQELAVKAVELPDDIRWHFVGPLQTNKVRIVRPIVELLHSLDRDHLAPAWLKGPGVAPPALLQVNIGREPQKHGVDPDEAMEACARYRALGVRVIGVMAIPPAVERAEDARPYFAALRAVRDELAGPFAEVVELSMGMTDDFEVAIEEGATLIRPGRAIFDV
jgi:pyridoxal phosphate enzyme (YggS family)